MRGYILRQMGNSIVVVVVIARVRNSGCYYYYYLVNEKAPCLLSEDNMESHSCITVQADMQPHALTRHPIISSHMQERLND